ncbi:hypothetical protein O71_22926 [Pontibacter sp. BAB1700]|nr:hypothetical protein O71_22926 [Pontibacter sp. BAB1700]
MFGDFFTGIDRLQRYDLYLHYEIKEIMLISQEKDTRCKTWDCRYKMTDGRH